MPKASQFSVALQAAAACAMHFASGDWRGHSRCGRGVELGGVRERNAITWPFFSFFSFRCRSSCKHFRVTLFVALKKLPPRAHLRSYKPSRAATRLIFRQDDSDGKPTDEREREKYLHLPVGIEREGGLDSVGSGRKKKKRERGSDRGNATSFFLLSLSSPLCHRFLSLSFSFS